MITPVLHFTAPRMHSEFSLSPGIINRALETRHWKRWSVRVASWMSTTWVLSAVILLYTDWPAPILIPANVFRTGHWRCGIGNGSYTGCFPDEHDVCCSGTAVNRLVCADMDPQQRCLQRSRSCLYRTISGGSIVLAPPARIRLPELGRPASSSRLTRSMATEVFVATLPCDGEVRLTRLRRKRNLGGLGL